MPETTRWRQELADKIKDVQASVHGVRVFAFGSFLKESDLLADVDLVVVYTDTEQVTGIRALLSDAAEEIPLHLTFFSPTEERELDFISVVGAIAVEDLRFRV